MHNLPTVTELIEKREAGKDIIQTKKQYLSNQKDKIIVQSSELKRKIAIGIVSLFFIVALSINSLLLTELVPVFIWMPLSFIIGWNTGDNIGKAARENYDTLFLKYYSNIWDKRIDKKINKEQYLPFEKNVEIEGEKVTVSILSDNNIIWSQSFTGTEYEDEIVDYILSTNVLIEQANNVLLDRTELLETEQFVQRIEKVAEM